MDLQDVLNGCSDSYRVYLYMQVNGRICGCSGKISKFRNLVTDLKVYSYSVKDYKLQIFLR